MQYNQERVDLWHVKGSQGHQKEKKQEEKEKENVNVEEEKAVGDN